MIPVNEPTIGSRELEYITECLSSGWISSAGPFVERFETAWAGYCGRRHGVGVTSGTAALQVGIRALGIGPGDEVILPTFTIMSCALAVIYAGATPVLVDADPRTWTIDVDQLESKVTPRTSAIVAVHIHGHPADMDAILRVAARHGLAVVEDAAEAHGSEYLRDRESPGRRWSRCGSFGDVSCFSFYANKAITTGEGGMLLTDDDALTDKARSLRNLCFSPHRRFEHDDLGFNFRLTSLQAAVGVAQIERMSQILARKREVGEMYTERLREIEGVELQVEEDWARSSYWMYPLTLTDDAGLDARELADRLRESEIETRPLFLGLHEQPVLRERDLVRDERHPVSERLSRRGLYVPSGVAISADEIDRVCSTVAEILS